MRYNNIRFSNPNFDYSINPNFLDIEFTPVPTNFNDPIFNNKFPIVAKSIPQKPQYYTIQPNGMKSASIDGSSEISNTSIHGIKASKIDFHSDFKCTVFLFNSSIDEIKLAGVGEHLYSIADDTIRNLIVGDFGRMGSYIPELALQRVSIENIEINECTIKSFSSFGTEIPNRLSFSGTNIESSLDLTEFDNYHSKECRLFFDYDIDISKLNLDYKNFKMIFTYDDDTLSHSKISESYKKLLEVQKEHGYKDGYEKLDKEYIKFKYKTDKRGLAILLNWLDSVWWDYGYNKTLIFRNAFLIMLLFFIINRVIYKKLIYRTYYQEEFVHAHKRLLSKYKGKGFNYFLLNTIYCLIYTGYIFWGLKLEIDKIRLNNIGLVCLVILEYLSGIICLGYIANYIFSR